MAVFSALYVAGTNNMLAYSFLPKARLKYRHIDIDEAKIVRTDGWNFQSIYIDINQEDFLSYMSNKFNLSIEMYSSPNVSLENLLNQRFHSDIIILAVDCFFLPMFDNNYKNVTANIFQ